MPETLVDDSVMIVRPKKHSWIFPIFAAILSAVGGLLFGYDTGVISGAMIQLRQQFALSHFYQELIVSVTLGTAAIAALGSAGLTDCAGRKPVIIGASFIFTVGAVVLGVAYTWEVILLGRLIVGFGIGMASMTVPVYIAEISPNHLRGALVTLSTVSITVGQMLAAIVDGIFMSNPVHGWRYMLALGGVPSVIQFFGFLAMPETPRWLVQRGRFSDAMKVLMRINGTNTITPEIEEELNNMVMAANDGRLVTESCRSNDSGEIVTELSTLNEPSSADDVPLTESDKPSCFARLTIIRMIKYAPTRRALLIGCSLQLFQQLVGINTVMYYSASIISMAGIGFSSTARNRDATVVWIAAVVASANFLFCVGSPWLIVRFRRRTLLLWSLSGVFTSLLLLGASFQVIASTSHPVSVVEPIPIEHDPLTCYKASTCDACMRTGACGFCYTMADGKVVNGSCLPSLGTFAEYSSYGRCANQSSIEPQAMWAFDYCPTPYGWLTVVGLILYLASFAPGMASLPWTINSELYPTWARSTGVACSTGVNWISNILVSLTFLSLTEVITRQGAYFLYAAVTSLAIIFVYKCVPETGDISLELLNQNPTPVDSEL